MNQAKIGIEFTLLVEEALVKSLTSEIQQVINDLGLDDSATFLKKQTIQHLLKKHRLATAQPTANTLLARAGVTA